MKPALLLSCALLVSAATFPTLAATITGTVSDRTTNKVAANDTVVLIGFGQGMQEIARTTTNAHGQYSFEVPESSAGTHLVRVDHQKATYFQPAPASAHTVDVDVYDVKETVKGITTEADVLNMQTDTQGLHVIENYFVKNASSPPLTQLSRQAYEIYLPAAAKIEATAAMGPGGMPVSSSPLPVGDPKTDPGHYAFVFPVRPGETRFQISYHLPYSGSLQFAQRAALATENLVIMLPKSMQFTPGTSAFQPVPDSVTSQTFVLKGVAAGHAVPFTIAGTGVMPREAQGADAGATGQSQAGAVGGEAGAAAGQGGPTAAQPESPGAPATGADTRPGGGLGPPIDTPDPLDKYKYWILTALALVLVVAAAWLLRKPRAQSGVAADRVATPKHVPAALQPTVLPTAIPDAVPARSLSEPQAGTNPGLLAALKEALFALETERLSGRTSEADYQQLKASLEVVIKQALEVGSARR